MISEQILILLGTLVALANCSAYDIGQISHDCLKNRAIVADYEPLGEIKIIDNLPVYEYDSEDNKHKNRMLIGVYDIYGFAYNNIRQVVDQLAVQNGGFRAILPDFYRGESWNPDSGANMAEWMARVGDCENVVKPDLINLVRHYQAEGVQEFAIFGLCWGGKVATNASIELSESFKASGLVHPSQVTYDDAGKVKTPMYLMPSNSEFDMIPFYEVLQEKFGENCGHRRFSDMSHGFSGARGNFSDPLIQERVNEVITTLGEFFNQNLNVTLDQGGNNSLKIESNYILNIALVTSVLVLLRR